MGDSKLKVSEAAVEHQQTHGGQVFPLVQRCDSPSPSLDDVERWIAANRDGLIKQAYEIGIADYGYIPLHQQSLAWGVSKKLKVAQRADNQVRFEWVVKGE